MKRKTTHQLGLSSDGRLCVNWSNISLPVVYPSVVSGIESARTIMTVARIETYIHSRQRLQEEDRGLKVPYTSR